MPGIVESVNMNDTYRYRSAHELERSNWMNVYSVRIEVPSTGLLRVCSPYMATGTRNCHNQTLNQWNRKRQEKELRIART